MGRQKEGRMRRDDKRRGKRRGKGREYLVCLKRAIRGRIIPVSLKGLLDEASVKDGQVGEVLSIFKEGLVLV